MSGPDRVLTRRDLLAGMTLAVLTGHGAAAQADEALAERFVTFDPPVPLWPISLVDRRGRPAILAPRSGRIGLIALWATWCPACHRDIPQLAAAQRTLGRAGIDVTLVNVDSEPVAKVLARAANMSAGALPMFFDPEGRRLAAQSPNGRRSPLQVFGMPILFLIDPAGLVRGYVKGTVAWADPTAIDFFRAFGDTARP